MQITDLAYIDSTGYHYADFPTFLTFVQGVFQGIYGADVYIENDAQDGQWLAALSQMCYDTAAGGASTYNSFSPKTAQGTGLSSVVKINGIRRITPTNSTADLTVTGAPGTTITDGQAQDTLNQLWNLPSPTTIPNAGTITVTATADQVGAVQAQANTITTIFTPTRGWLTVNNASAATAGQPVEQDGTLRARQTVSTANPSKSVFEGTLGAVANIPGVTSSVGYENDSDTTDGNGIGAHSIGMVVAGGDSMAIAQAIADHKGPGSGTSGSTTEVVYDDQGLPLTIKFYRPSTATISAQIVLATFEGWTSDYIADIQQAVASYINAQGIGAVGTGGSILLSKLYISAYLPDNPAASQTYDVISIQLKKNSGSFAAANVALNFNELPNCDPNTNVSVTV